MSPEGWSGVVGGLAGTATTLAFVPQVIKTWRQGGRDLSWGMLCVYLLGVWLWFAYGVLISAPSVIIANAATTVLITTAIWLKFRGGRTGSSKPRVAIDMDEVIADFATKVVRELTEGRGVEFAEKSHEGRTLEESLTPEELGRIRDLLSDPTFFRDLDVIEGSQEVVRALSERYEIYIASAAMDVPASFAAKYAWLREHFPFIPPSHYVFCGDKSVLEVDYLIDDQPRHFERFRGTGLLFSTPHNRGENRFKRVGSWAEVRELLLGLR
jgi:5'(3')-deoxyribonucleotidase/uncharacterized protein with PQ loop repeat